MILHRKMHAGKAFLRSFPKGAKRIGSYPQQPFCYCGADANNLLRNLPSCSFLLSKYPRVQLNAIRIFLTSRHNVYCNCLIYFEIGDMKQWWIVTTCAVSSYTSYDRCCFAADVQGLLRCRIVVSSV